MRSRRSVTIRFCAVYLSLAVLFTVVVVTAAQKTGSLFVGVMAFAAVTIILTLSVEPIINWSEGRWKRNRRRK